MLDEGYLSRLVLPVSLIDATQAKAAAYYYRAERPLDEAALPVQTSAAGTAIMWLLGTDTAVARPLRDMLSAPSLRAISGRFHMPIQRCHGMRHYGEFVARELHAIGFSVLSAPTMDGAGRPVFDADMEANAEQAAALWSGLRINGMAMSLRLHASSCGRIDWEQARLALVAGVPFVELAYDLATADALRQLMREQRFVGVSCVFSLFSGRPDETGAVARVRECLDDGWTCVLLDDVDDGEALAIARALDRETVGEAAAHRDAVGRLGKRREQLAAVEKRGAGFVSLDRDPMYHDQRRLLAKKIGVPDDEYARKEAPARPGSLVRFTYELQVDGEGVIDASGDGGVKAILGRGQVVAGLEKALFGRVKGETFEVCVPSDDAYGPYEKTQRRLFPRQGLLLQAGDRLEPGAMVTIIRAPGDVVRGRVTSLDADSVEIDANHPLAGKELRFHVRIVDII